jgi:hypothetical protein
MSRNQVFAAGATLAVVVGLGLGFYQAGSPHLQRLAKADESRVQDLNEISQAVRRYHSQNLKLPQYLTELDQIGPPFRIADPETRAPYEYRTLDERRFELCAVFATDNRTEVRRVPGDRPHAAGRQCFSF